MPPAVPKSLFNQIVPPEYSPGVFTFGEKKELPDWENLRQHVQTHSATELIPRATSDPDLQQVVCDAVQTLLNLRRANSDYLIETLTPEELWGSIFEMVGLHTGNPNPYRSDKLKARQTALDLLSDFWEDSWRTRLKLVVAGNIIDYSSARVVNKLNANPEYFSEALRAAVAIPFAIDFYEQFYEKVIDGAPQQILWLADNDGEVIFDIAFVQELVQYGHQIIVVGKVDNASNDVTLADLHEITGYPQFQELQEAIRDGVVQLISSGAKNDWHQPLSGNTRICECAVGN